MLPAVLSLPFVAVSLEPPLGLLTAWILVCGLSAHPGWCLNTLFPRTNQDPLLKASVGSSGPQNRRGFGFI